MHSLSLRSLKHFLHNFTKEKKNDWLTFNTPLPLQYFNIWRFSVSGRKKYLLLFGTIGLSLLSHDPSSSICHTELSPKMTNNPYTCRNTVYSLLRKQSLICLPHFPKKGKLLSSMYLRQVHIFIMHLQIQVLVLQQYFPHFNFGEPWRSTPPQPKKNPPSFSNRSMGQFFVIFLGR